MKKHLLFLTALIFVASCSPVQYVTTTTTEYDYSESSARLLEGSSNFMVTPIIADLNVSGTKISYVEKDAFSNFTVTRQVISNIAAYKRIALSRAAKAHNADILVVRRLMSRP